MSAHAAVVLKREINVGKGRPADPISNKVVITFSDPLGIWSAPAWLGERMARDFPQLEVVHMPHQDRLTAEIADTDIVIAWPLKPEQFAGARRLKWIHALSTDANQLACQDVINREIVITNAKDVHVSLSEQAVTGQSAPPSFTAASEALWKRNYDLIAENMARFLDGRPLLNQVNKRRACRLADLRRLLENKFVETYYTREQAEKIVDVLMYAEMTGKNTQGVLKLSGTEPMQKIKPEYPPRVIKETKVSALIDGGGNAAILVCRLANEIAIQKCKENGIAIVGTQRTFASSGAISYYAEEMTKHDLIGMILAGSPGSVAPFGSLDPLLGTNPMAFGFPTMNDPVILDMATAAITWYGLVRAQILGQKLPEGLTIDQDGNPTTDPSQAMKGAILPFDKSYKGSGLGLVVEILTGSLAGADLAGNWSNTFIAIDPDILVGKEAFKKSCTELVDKVKNSRKVKGINEVLIPGEGAMKRKKRIERAGEIEMEDTVLASLNS